VGLAGWFRSSFFSSMQTRIWQVPLHGYSQFFIKKEYNRLFITLQNKSELSEVIGNIALIHPLAGHLWRKG